MACGQNCGLSKSENSPEYQKDFKAENNSGSCGCGNGDNDCSTPSNAREGSPLWEWEQIYGKLVTYFTKEFDENGRSYTKIERKPCPKEIKRSGQNRCCSVKYKISR